MLGAAAIVLGMVALHAEGTVQVGLGIAASFALLIAWAVWPLREIARD